MMTGRGCDDIFQILDSRNATFGDMFRRCELRYGLDNFHFTRLDVAIDDKNEIPFFTVEQIKKKCEKEEFIANSEGYHFDESKFDDFDTAKTVYVYAWRLTPADPTPKGKREKPSLREMEQQIRRDMEDGIDSKGKKMTLCQLYAKQNAQRANVKKSTQKQREQLMRLLKEDKLGARSIDTIKPSDAKEWALRMKEKGFSYNTINNHKRSLKTFWAGRGAWF